MRLCATAAAVALALAPGARAEERPVLVALPVSSPVRVDGLLDEPAWAQALPVALTQQAPKPGAPTPFRTTVRVLVTPSTLYFGVECSDPEPARISIHAALRDSVGDGDDTVRIVLDPAGDGRNTYFFAVNPAGALADGLSASTESVSLLWDGVWDARARVGPRGWSAEVAIPATTIRFPAGRSSFRVNFGRTVAREQLELRWSGLTLDAKLLDMERAGLLEGVGALRPGLGFELRPALAVRREDDFATARSVTKGQPSLDAGANLSAQLKAEVTVNTDFAETEVDARQVNLTRFPLFFPEKRAFFLEGSNQYDFGLGLGTDFVPFYSRRVGLHAGRPVPILAGAKVFGRAGPVGLALLDVETDAANGAERGNAFAGRATLDVDEHLRVGAIATRGEPSGTRDNTLAGLDAVWKTSRLFGDKDLLVGVWGARSFGNVGEGRRGGWGLKVDYPNDLWDLSLTLRELGDALDPGLGFVPRPGTRYARAGIAYQPRPSKEGALKLVRQLFFELEPEVTTDLGGRVQSRGVYTTPFRAQLESGDSVELHVIPTFERLEEPFEIVPGVVIPAGDHSFTMNRVEFDTSRARPLWASVAYGHGGFYTGTLTDVWGQAGWTGLRGRLSVALDWLSDSARLPQGDFLTRVWDVRLTAAFTRDLVLSAFVQYDSLSRDVGTFARLQLTLRPGTDLFVVWSRDAREPGEDGALRLLPVANQLSVKLRATLRP